MRLSIASASIAAAALAVASSAEGAPILIEFVAPQPSSASTMLMATDQQHLDPDLTAHLSLLHLERRTVSPTDDPEEDQPAIVRLQARGVSEREQSILDTMSKFVEDLDGAIRDEGSSSTPFIEPNILRSSVKNGPAWAAQHPELAHAYHAIRWRLPTLRNGLPDLGTLAKIAPKQQFVPRYSDIQRLIKNVSRRRSGSAGYAPRKADAPPSSHAQRFSGSKRKLHGEDDLSEARLIAESASLPKLEDGRINRYQVSPEEREVHRAAQRLALNSKKREKHKARKLISQSPQDSAV